MQTLNITPGPWITPEGSMGDIKTPDGAYIAAVLCDIVVGETWKIRGPSVPLAQAIANGHLIRNAPGLLTDLQTAAATLRRYEALHRAKGTAESTEKAEVNAALAARFEATIANATGGAS